jgi:hypothetical protein
MTWLLSARFVVIGLLLTIAAALVWAAVADYE